MPIDIFGRAARITVWPRDPPFLPEGEESPGGWKLASKWRQGGGRRQGQNGWKSEISVRNGQISVPNHECSVLVAAESAQDAPEMSPATTA